VGYLGIGRRAQPGLPPGTVTAPSFIEKELTAITGTNFTGTASINPADPTFIGNLWNFPLCKLNFTVQGIASGQETNALNLDTDAMLAAVKGAALVGIPPGMCASCGSTEIAIQASGPIRGNLVPSSYEPHQYVGFADVYHVVPLGGDPTAQAPTSMSDLNAVQNYLNAVPGFPLVKVNIPTVALRAAFEGILQTGLLVNGDFFPGTSGLVVQYDPTLPPFDSTNPLSLGWVKYMALVSPTGTTTAVLYDVSNAACNPAAHFCVNPTAMRAVATTLYIAGVAQSLGIPLYDDIGTQLTTQTQLATRVVRRMNGESIKDFEALGQYLAATCALTPTGPTGFLPSTYDATTTEGKIPRRVVNCAGGCP
jgi:hypothetical protein